MGRLIENSAIPLYFQLQELIRARIEDGTFKRGELIPTELELQKIYSVSRSTVRKAIEGLVFEDLLVKKQGLGTLVAKPRMVEDLFKLKSFTEKMEAQNANISTKVLDVRKIEASRRICEHLHIEAGEQIIFIKRLRYVDNEPITLFTSHIPAYLGVKEDDDFTGSIFKLLEEKYEQRISYGERIVEAGASGKEEAQLLGINQGEPVLIIRNIVFNIDDTPIEYAEGIYRSDRYKYVFRLKR